MIEITEQFEVAAPVVTVWRLLADPDAIVTCVPGAAITGRDEDGSLLTTVTVKFGPLGVTFRAVAQLELDELEHQGKITARGRDNQGGARFQATASFGVSADAAGSVVVTRGEVEISGRLASMIEGGASVVVKRMAAEFAACLQARCTAV